MATTQDCMGLGMPPALAGKVGHTINPGSFAGGTASQSGATTIPTSATILGPVAGNASYILPAAPSAAKEYYVANPTAVAATVYPPVGGTINGGSTNASVTVAANSMTIFYCLGKLTWFAK